MLKDGSYLLDRTMQYDCMEILITVAVKLGVGRDVIKGPETSAVAGSTGPILQAREPRVLTLKLGPFIVY